MKKAKIEILYRDRDDLFDAISGLWEQLQSDNDNLDWTSEDDEGNIEYQRTVIIEDSNKDLDR